MSGLHAFGRLVVKSVGLPSPFKTWQTPVTVANTLHGDAVANAKDVVTRLFNALIALGWTTKGSGDGVTAAMDGVNRILAYTNWQGTGGGLRSWWCIENGAGAQMVFYDNGDNGTDYVNFKCNYSPDGGYTGGTTMAVPTAPHGMDVDMSSAPFGSGGGGHGADVYTARIVCSTDAKCTRILWFIGSVGFGFWALDQARVAKAAWSPANYFMNDQYGVNSSRPGGLITNFQNNFGDGRTYAYVNGNKVGEFGSQQAFATGMYSNIGAPSGFALSVTTVNGLTGLFDILPLAFAVPSVTVPAIRGALGIAPDLYVIPRLADGSPTQKYTSGSTTPLAGTREWITYGDLLIPWGGGAVNGNVGDFDLFDVGAACVCPDPVSPLSEVASVSSLGNTGPDFGQDVDAIIDVPLSWALASGFRNLGNAIARRLDFLRFFLNAGLSESQLSQLRGDIVRAVMADERVQAIDRMDFAFNAQTLELRISLRLNTAEGPFATIFLLTPTSVTMVPSA